MKLTSKGQVTIPQHIRRFLGVSAHSAVNFRIKGDTVILEKENLEKRNAGTVSRFAALRGSKRGDLTTEQWIAATRGE